jgi:hypothetical protein
LTSRFLALIAFILSSALTGCATSPELQPTASDMKPENVRSLIAKDLLGTLVFGRPFKTKVINAKISAPEIDSTGSGEPVTSYCVNAYLENPLFPIHRAVSSRVRVLRKNGKAVTISRERPDAHCDGTGFEPFPEIEKLSAERYNAP